LDNTEFLCNVPAASLPIVHWGICPQVCTIVFFFPGLSHPHKTIYKNCRCPGTKYWPSSRQKISPTRIIQCRALSFV